MTNRIIFIVYSVIILSGCGKPEDDDLSGTFEITGKIYSEDVNAGNPKKELAKQEIFIRKKSSDPSFYLYSVRSDNSGYFTFTNIKKDTIYEIFSSITSTSLTFTSIKFSGALAFTSASKNVELILKPPTMNGFRIKVNDQYNSPVYHAQICVFNSKTLFDANSCLGNVFVLLSDSTGKAEKYNISPGNYYFRLEYKDSITNLKGIGGNLIATQGILDTTIVIH